MMVNWIMMREKLISLTAVASLAILTSSCTRLFQEEAAPPPPHLTKAGLVSPSEAAPIGESWTQSIGEGVYKIGKPYKVNGVWYFPKEDYNYDEVGYASWYGNDFHNKRTANGEIFDVNMLSAAHKTLPLPSVVRVTNLQNGRSLILRVNDRGPFVNDRIMDVSKKAAQLLGFKDQGTTKVRVELLPEESMTVASLTKNTGTLPPDQVKPAEAGEVVITNELEKIKEESLQTPAIGGELPGGTLNNQEDLFDAPPVNSLSRHATEKSVPVISEDDYNRQLEQSLLAPQHSESIREFEDFPREVTPPSLKVGGKSFFIQAGVFSRQDNARRATKNLQPTGNSAMQKIQTRHGTMYNVQVGPFKNKSEATQALKQIRVLGYADARMITK